MEAPLWTFVRTGVYFGSRVVSADERVTRTVGGPPDERALDRTGSGWAGSGRGWPGGWLSRTWLDRAWLGLADSNRTWP
ncbi:hypothetical protein GCM10010428_58020 [Actinosynnema pretiosum subsp. pretiosum]